MNHSTPKIALPSRSFEQGNGIWSDLVNTGRVKNDAGRFVPDAGGSGAQLAAIRTGFFQPLGPRAIVSAQQPDACMVSV